LRKKIKIIRKQKILNYKVNVNPFLSFSGFNQPEPLKRNFDKFFNTLNANKVAVNQGGAKRQIAIFKTKAIENHMKNKEDLKRSISEYKNTAKANDPLEWNRNEVDLSEAVKVVGGKKAKTNITRSKTLKKAINNVKKK